jgi:hypothetical protein|tara:strand:- start:2400 stop:3347 length:948 start_codon:yes stop_codon:yes gene_type:complete
MGFNYNSGYGQLAQSTPFLGGGQVFVVAKSAAAGREILQQVFKSDPLGNLRYYATVQAAVDECVANRGDVIYVAPGHTETVTATSLDLETAGITIINLGSGALAPTYTFGAAAATIDVSAANITWIGGLLVANFLDVASAFTIGTAANFHLDGAKFEDNTSSLNFLSCVTTSAVANEADGLKVLNCFQYGLNTTPLAFVSILEDQLDVEISGNTCDQAATADVGHFLTLSSKDILGARIRDNVLTVVGSAGATVGIFLTGSGSSSTGDVSRNYVSSLDTTGELIATAGTGLVYFENYYTGVADKSGKLWPVVDAA